MSEREEREIELVRLRLIDTIQSFFMGEPSAEKLRCWRTMFTALSKTRVNLDFDQSVKALHLCLEEMTLAELQDEYYLLFANPFSDKQLSTSISYHLDGKAYGQTLVELRGIMAEIGLEKREGVIETEDSLVIVLEIFSALITGDVDVDREKGEALRVELLHRYLIPLSKRITAAFEHNEMAIFYRACSGFLHSYLELEKTIGGGNEGRTDQKALFSQISPGRNHGGWRFGGGGRLRQNKATGGGRRARR